jgi:hypothetical protein
MDMENGRKANKTWEVEEMSAVHRWALDATDDGFKETESSLMFCLLTLILRVTETLFWWPPESALQKVAR